MSGDIVVVDYGMGNLRSVWRALEKVSGTARVRVSSDPAVIGSAAKVVFPGQGAARDCMRNLQSAALIDSVDDAFRNKPFLGICMGLQVLFEHSDENGGVSCLGKVPGQVRRFDRSLRQSPSGQPAGKIPHMGWSQVQQTCSHPLWQGIDDLTRFYFVHSYYVVPERSGQIAATTDYLVSFVSAIGSENVFATQFHPEKSAADGLRLLHNFVHWKVH